MEFGVWRLEIGISSLEFEDWSLRLKVQGLGLRVWEFGGQGVVCRIRVWG